MLGILLFQKYEKGCLQKKRVVNNLHHLEKHSNFVKLISKQNHMRMSRFHFFVFALILISCENEKIDVSGSRFSLPEPDKNFRIEHEIHVHLNKLTQEVKISNKIAHHESGKKIIESELAILPYLSPFFTDSTETAIYSERNQRTITKGELAIVLASKIKPFPIAALIGVQQCTPPFKTEAEDFLNQIQKNPTEFTNRYQTWLKEIFTNKN